MLCGDGMLMPVSLAWDLHMDEANTFSLPEPQGWAHCPRGFFRSGPFLLPVLGAQKSPKKAGLCPENGSVGHCAHSGKRREVFLRIEVWTSKGWSLAIGLVAGASQMWASLKPYANVGQYGCVFFGVHLRSVLKGTKLGHQPYWCPLKETPILGSKSSQ